MRQRIYDVIRRHVAAGAAHVGDDDARLSGICLPPHMPRDEARIGIIATASGTRDRHSDLRALIGGAVLRVRNAGERKDGGRYTSLHHSDLSKHGCFRHAQRVVGSLKGRGVPSATGMRKTSSVIATMA